MISITLNFEVVIYCPEHSFSFWMFHVSFKSISTLLVLDGIIELCRKEVPIRCMYIHTYHMYTYILHFCVYIYLYVYNICAYTEIHSLKELNHAIVRSANSKNCSTGPKRLESLTEADVAVKSEDILEAEILPPWKTSAFSLKTFNWFNKG